MQCVMHTDVNVAFQLGLLSLLDISAEGACMLWTLLTQGCPGWRHIGLLRELSAISHKP